MGDNANSDNTSLDYPDAIGILRNNPSVQWAPREASSSSEVSATITSTMRSLFFSNGRDAECYKMNHKKRGIGLIINHYTFEGKGRESTRHGTEKDVKALKRVLEDLQFDVIVRQDYKYSEIMDQIHSVAEADHTDSDCLAVAVLTHGSAEGKLRAKDHLYDADNLWKPFTGDKCQSLAGKPKLFFIQACRGKMFDDGVTIESDSSFGNRYTIPVMADILIMYSTYEDHYSFRDPKHGSWFIQCLSAALKEYARDRDLVTILTFLNRTMAIYYTTDSIEDEELRGKKQIGTIVSTLTRLVYFNID